MGAVGWVCVIRRTCPWALRTCALPRKLGRVIGALRVRVSSVKVMTAGRWHWAGGTTFVIEGRWAMSESFKVQLRCSTSTLMSADRNFRIPCHWKGGACLAGDRHS